MTEAVTVSNVIAIASLVSDIWLEKQRKDRHTHSLGFFRKVCKAVSDFAVH